jgi:hypothetical protein
MIHPDLANHAHQKWPSATRINPCPKCGKENRCRVAPDGLAGICWRSGSSEVWHDPAGKTNGNGFHRKPDPAPSRPKQTFTTAGEALQSMVDRSPAAAWLLKIFHYRKNGEEFAVVGRWDDPNGADKTCRPAHRLANGWAAGDPETQWPLYRIDELSTDGLVTVLEGERKTDLAISLGLNAVTSSHGSGGASLTDWSTLKGRDVAILADNDEAGEKYAANVASILLNLGCRAKIVRLPELPPGGDLEQFDAAVGSTPEATRAAILELADAVPWREPDQIKPVSLGDIWKSDPELREPVIDGILRRGQVGNLVSTSKSYKTFMIIALAVAMVQRKMWLDRFQTVGGRVLIIDLELQKPDITRRTHDIAGAMFAPLDEVANGIDVLSFRGRDGSIDRIEPVLMKIRPRTYSLVILDPLYKSYPAQFDENSNAQMTWQYRRFERIAEHLDAAFLAIHHTSKGAQNEKRIVDVGAGASAQARSPDAHMVIREHEVDGAVVFDAKCRSFRPNDPIALKWEYPLWHRDLSLDPTQLKTGGRSRANRQEPEPAPKPDPWTMERFAEVFIKDAVRPKQQIIDQATLSNIPQREAERLIRLAIAAGKAFVWSFPKDNRHYLANREQTVTEVAKP